MRKILNIKANDITIGGTILFTVTIYVLLMAMYWIIENISSITEIFVAIKEWFSIKVNSLKRRFSAKKES